MEHDFESLTSLTNQQVLTRVKTLAAGERQATVALIGALAELDARRLYLGEGFSSLFTYCTQALHLSEHAAYNRIEAARIARKWPVILQMLADGSVTITTVRLLADSLTDANHRQLLEAAMYKSKREVEHLVAALHPQAPVRSTVRRLPVPRPAQTAAPGCAESSMTPPSALQSVAPASDPPPASAPPCRPAVVAPLAPERYKVQFTVSRDRGALWSAGSARARRHENLARHICRRWGRRRRPDLARRLPVAVTRPATRTLNYRAILSRRVQLPERFPARGDGALCDRTAAAADAETFGV
jgi:hypothetical protein